MAYSPVPVEQFGGLNLVDDVQEVGTQAAIDLLNVDLDQPGRLRSRDGFTAFTAAAGATNYWRLFPFYTDAGTKQLVGTFQVPSVLGGPTIRALTTAGATVATYNGAAGEDYWQAVRFGSPTTDYMYIAGRQSPAGTGPQAVVRWDGAAFTTPAGVPFVRYLTVQSPDNRMVGAAGSGAAASAKVEFSNAGDAETWDANDFVYITPGDGEPITGLASWQNLVFAFKESKFAVFTGNSVGSTGSPVFNYRMVNTGTGTPGAICSGRPGVFFMNRRGIYLTTGGEPQLISRKIDPLFLGNPAGTYTDSAINLTYLFVDATTARTSTAGASMYWQGERLYVAVPTGASTTNDRLLVWDSIRDDWTIWDIAANGVSSFRASDSEDLVFSYATGANDIGRMNVAYTTDNGTAITSRYQSGIYELGPPGSTADTRWTRLWGSGSPTVSVFTDYASSDANAAAVTLGTDPDVAEGFHLKSYRGRMFSHKISATTAWSLSRLLHDVAWVQR